jgi:hypothetical protein
VTVTVMTPKEHAAMPAPTCDRCRLLETETWRLSQRQLELERRLQHLAVALDRLAALVQAMRRERRAS